MRASLRYDRKEPLEPRRPQLPRHHCRVSSAIPIRQPTQPSNRANGIEKLPPSKTPHLTLPWHSLRHQVPTLHHSRTLGWHGWHFGHVHVCSHEYMLQSNGIVFIISPPI